MNKQEILTRFQGIVSVSPEVWELNPCIARTTLQKYERKIGLRLPEAYRLFLLHIGNGAKEPYLGLYALEKTLKYIKEKNLHLLAQPFPFQEKYEIQDFEAYHALTIDGFHLPGSLPICNYGCGIDFLLITAGEQQGEIWFHDADNSESLYPLYAKNGEKYNFLTWFEAYAKNGDIFEEM